MPSWNQVLDEINGSNRVDGLDYIRRKYIKELSNFRQRNVIAYYSGFLQRPGVYHTSINDDDKNALMAAIHGLDRTKGLDLLLHTPGGDMAATESLIDYLHRMFHKDIVAFVPLIAMSGGTMIACSTKEIYMGKQSNIGPIDPQFNGIPAHGVIKEFEEAMQQMKNDQGTIPAWSIILGKYHPTFIGQCKNSIALATEIVKSKLIDTMFAADEDPEKKADDVTNFLNETNDSKLHARHINIDDAKKCGLKIRALEDDNALQDLILTVHHCFMHTFSSSNAVKITENQNGVALVSNAPRT